MAQDKTIFNNDNLETVGKIVRAVNHPLRQSILELLKPKELPVTDIYTTLRIEQSVCSQQIKILKDAKTITERREGKYR